MILTTRHIPASDFAAAGKYVTSPGKNEKVSVLRGSTAIFGLAALASKISGHKAALRHLTISPSDMMTPRDLIKFLETYQKEFGIPDEVMNTAFIVKHTKPRTSGTLTDDHYHVVFNAITKDGKTLDDKQDFMRHEFLSRVWEIENNQPLTVGAHNGYVGDRLKKERPDLHEGREEFKKVLAAKQVEAGYDDADAHRFAWEYKAKSVFTEAQAKLYSKLSKGKDLADLIETLKRKAQDYHDWRSFLFDIAQGEITYARAGTHIMLLVKGQRIATLSRAIQFTKDGPEIAPDLQKILSNSDQ